MNKKQQWNEFWETESDSHEVFICGGDDKNTTLSMLWQSVFSKFNNEDRIVDVASGAGSLYRSIDTSRFSDLVAVDCSASALAILHKDLPSVRTIEQDIRKLHTMISDADQIVSQFGIEYGGINAFEASIGILSDGGSIHCLCHADSSSIPVQQQQQLEGIELIKSSEFLLLAMRCISAMYKNDVPLIEKSIEQFRRVEPLLAGFASKYPATFAAHIHSSLKSMIIRLKHYDEKVVTQWCENALIQCDELASRARDILNVALSTEKIDQIKKLFVSNNLENVVVKSIINDNNTTVIGLLISANKPS